MDIVDIGRKPVPGDYPAGRNIRNDASYDALSNEINKMTSINQSTTTDWNLIVNVSRDIIENKSKDILVCSYLCMGLFKTDGIKGLATGIHVLKDMIENFWDDLFPPKARIQGRINPISWLIESLENTLDGMQGTCTWPKNDISPITEDIESIETFLNDKLDNPPDFFSLTKKLNLFIEAEKPDKNITEKSSPTQHVVKTSAQVFSVPEGDMLSDDDIDKAMRQVFDVLRKILQTLNRKQSPDALAFRVSRFIAWSTVDAVPPCDADSKTFLPAPDEQVRRILATLYQSGSWKELLEFAEPKISEYLFWLDLSRYVAEALKHMGFADISDEVAGLTALYAKRLAGMEKLLFSDGTPFADSETRDWIENLMQKENQADKGFLVSKGDGIDDVISRDMDEAEKQAQADNFQSAIKGLRSKIASASSERERFIREVWFCRFLLKNNKKELVFPYSKSILEIIDNYRLDQWEPELAVSAYETILSGLSKLKDEGAENLKKDVIRRLSLIDPGRALIFLERR